MTKWKLLPTDLTLEMKVAGLNKIDLALRVGMPEYDLTDGIEMAWDAMIKVAPTPPEVEPVGYVRPRAMKEILDGQHDGHVLHARKGMIYSEPLYVQPAPPSELVKTARAVIDRIDQIRKTGVGTLALDAELEYLRTELAKVK